VQLRGVCSEVYVSARGELKSASDVLGAQIFQLDVSGDLLNNFMLQTVCSPDLNEA
jgi:hypothetical protein